MGLPDVSPLFPQRPVMNPVTPPAQTATSYPVFGKHEIQYVQGYEGANAVQMPPNSSDIFPDQELSVIWVVMTDQNGNKSLVKGLNVGGEYVPPKPITMEDLMAEMRDMKERLIRVEEGSYEPNKKHDFKGKPVRTDTPTGAGGNTGRTEPASGASK